MLITFEDRLSDSPVVERIWRSHSEAAGSFSSMATCNWGIVVTRLRGQTSFTVRGPETMATVADCPAEGEWIGIHFKLGTFMPDLPPGYLRDRNDVTLPTLSKRSFSLNGSSWEYPTYENVETFVARLVRKGLVVAEPCFETSPVNRPTNRSLRTEQRRFLQVTGMTHSTARQIERARQACYLLKHGAPILQVTYDLGFYDQAHLTRSLKRFCGQTPAQIARGDGQLSLLYNTSKTAFANFGKT